MIGSLLTKLTESDSVITNFDEEQWNPHINI